VQGGGGEGMQGSRRMSEKIHQGCPLVIKRGMKGGGWRHQKDHSSGIKGGKRAQKSGEEEIKDGTPKIWKGEMITTSTGRTVS